MTDEQAFLEAIRNSPDDDLPRLVYADYLEERGEGERAEFVRFQCDPRNHGAHNGTREYAIAERYADDWFGLTAISGRKRNRKGFDWYFSDYGPPNLMVRWGRRDEHGERVWVELPIRRGFFASAECPAAWWLRHGDAVTARHPVTAVRLTDRPRVELCSPGSDSYRLTGREAFLPEQPGPVVPWEGDGQSYATLRPPTAEELLAAEWPGVAFTLPPAEPMPPTFMGIPLYEWPTLSQARRLVSHLTERRVDEERAVTMLRGAERFGFSDAQVSWAEAAIRAAFELVRVMDSDPTATEPLGILNADEPDLAAAPPPRRRRPDFSAARWQPRFPRPR